MKKLKYKFSIIGILSIALVLGLAQCKPKVEEGPEMGAPPTADEVSFSYTYLTANKIQFKNESSATGIASWDLGKGAAPVSGNTITADYPRKGDYEIVLTLFARGGSAKSTKIVPIAEDDLGGYCDNPDYVNLTGGCDSPGKKWIWAKAEAGHLGVGPVESTSPDWWSAAPYEKEGLGMYDDTMVFSMENLHYAYENNNSTYANKAFWADFGLASEPSEDFTSEYTAADNMTFMITESDGAKMLSFTSNGFMSYYYGVPVTYEIISLTEDFMELSSVHPGLKWFYKFTTPGTEPPPPVEKPLESNDIYDDFDIEGTMEWTFQGDEGGTFNDDFDNPDASGINTSGKVAEYVRGGAFEWTNVQFELDYRMDLSNRNKFSMMVYFPSSNTGLSAENQTVAVKLQDSKLGDNAWTTQVEVKHEITDLDTWVEVEFDFSAPEISERTDFDKIVVQFGGEGHFEAGTFYFDDFKLLEGGSGGEYQLVWNDEFDNTGGPDLSKWGFDVGTGQNGWGNEEAQFYTDRLQNSWVSGGNLNIKAEKESYGGQSYTSARLKSQGKFSFTHGRVDVSARLPEGRGVWPAIWMLGSNIPSAGWPACGEIDIMEYVGFDPGIIHGSIHTPSSYGLTQNTGTLNVPDCETTYHVYSVEWTDKEIRFLVDDQNFYTYKPDVYNDDTWPFNDDMFLILNVAVGGTWGGQQGIDDSIFPQTMEIDYVRVYQK